MEVERMFKSKAMKKLEADLAAKQKEAAAINAKADATEDEINKARQEIKNLKAKIESQKELDDGKTFDESGEEVIDRTPVNHPLPAEVKDHKGPFNSFGEQLSAIVKSSPKGASVDPRLIAVQNAASGANETVPSEGGFLVQTDFSTELLKNVYETGVLAPKCRKINISAGSNGVKINGIDESSRADGSRWGGVQGYWSEEAGTITASKPKFRQIELKLNKLMALYYATDELLQDAASMESVFSQAFAEEIKFKLDDAIFRGDGSGKPLGILSAGCLVTQAAESGQAADTVLFENIINMWSRLIATSRANSIWLINQEIEPQLYGMVLSSGTSAVPVYMPANGVSGSPYATLFARPVIPIEHASKLGDAGDIVLADMGQYLLADKAGMNMASSIHIKFVEDETAFRVTYRVDGQPVRSAAITPYKATASRTLSSFVTLAAR
jgi:HK97 family phage major capsid protein